ncbi:unnamed protein product, partial [Hymenolepis diminuta]
CKFLLLISFQFCNSDFSCNIATEVLEGRFLLPPEAVTAFEEVKTLLTDCSTFAYQEPEAILTLSTDISQISVGGVLEQRKGDVVRSLALFSAKVTPT